MHDQPFDWPPLHPRARIWVDLIRGLSVAAESGAREAMRALHHRLRRRVGRTLRPGPETPLWNELIRQARPHLRRRGSKAQLARLLKLPRQRLQDCLKAKTACLDAERTLLLLCWIAARRGGDEILR